MQSDASHTVLRAAVVGYGAYGNVHARKYLEHPATQLVAIADNDPERLRAAHAAIPAVRTVSNLDELIGGADIASVVVPASEHHHVARQLLDAGIHLLVEKPFTTSLADARDLATVADSRGLVLQPGYLERFNLMPSRLRACLPSPRYLEMRRLTCWRGRGTDVNVIMDLMIHDIDLLLEITTTPVTQVQARGLRVFSDQWDVANAQLHFASGCVANLTASRASPAPERRLHAFSEKACALIDIDTGLLLLHECTADTAGIVTKKRLCCHGDPLAAEIDAFVQAVRNHATPTVTAADACRALDVAEQITAVIEQDTDVLARTAIPQMNSKRAIAYLLQNQRQRHG